MMRVGWPATCQRRGGLSGPTTRVAVEVPRGLVGSRLLPPPYRLAVEQAACLQPIASHISARPWARCHSAARSMEVNTNQIANAIPPYLVTHRMNPTDPPLLGALLLHAAQRERHVHRIGEGRQQKTDSGMR